MEARSFLAMRAVRLSNVLPTIQRHAPVDSASAAEGFDFSERSAGTNGLEPRSKSGAPCSCAEMNTSTMPVLVGGGPVEAPDHKHIVGSISIACRLRMPAQQCLLASTLLDNEQRLLLAATATAQCSVIRIAEQVKFVSTRGPQ